MDKRTGLALVIGIDPYGSGIPPLQSARHDASTLAELLRTQHGYEVTCLLDGAATKARCHEALQALIAGAGPSDRVVFYFAGHGLADTVADPARGPSGFLIPADARRDDPHSFWPMHEVQGALAKTQSLHLLVLLDCCFAGAFRWSRTRNLRVQRKTLYRERFERYRRDPAWQVITSAAQVRMVSRTASTAITSAPCGRSAMARVAASTASITTSFSAARPIATSTSRTGAVAGSAAPTAHISAATTAWRTSSLPAAVPTSTQRSRIASLCRTPSSASHAPAGAAAATLGIHCASGSRVASPPHSRPTATSRSAICAAVSPPALTSCSSRFSRMVMARGLAASGVASAPITFAGHTSSERQCP